MYFCPLLEYSVADEAGFATEERCIIMDTNAVTGGGHLSWKIVPCQTSAAYVCKTGNSKKSLITNGCNYCFCSLGQSVHPKALEFSRPAVSVFPLSREFTRKDTTDRNLLVDGSLR